MANHPRRIQLKNNNRYKQTSNIFYSIYIVLLLPLLVSEAFSLRNQPTIPSSAENNLHTVMSTPEDTVVTTTFTSPIADDDNVENKNYFDNIE